MLARWMTHALAALTLLLGARAAGAQLADAQPEWYLRGSGGCRLFVQEFGRGRDTLVILHGGWGSEHSYLFDALRGLEGRYHLVLYDQRGSLRSPCADRLVTVDAHVADLERLRAQLRLERMTLVGHSNGTLLATLYLARHPDRVRGLVLTGPGMVVPRTPVTPEDSALAAAQSEAMAAFLERPEIAAELRRQGLLGNASALSDAQLTAAWRIQFAGANVYHVDRWRQVKGGQVFWSRAAAEAAARSMPETYDFVPALKAHRCPVWVIVGDHDFGTGTVALQRHWVREVPRARFVVIERAGHEAWIDAPEEFRRVFGEALRSAVTCAG